MNLLKCCSRICIGFILLASIQQHGLVAQNLRPATPLPLGTTMRVNFDRGEQKDYAIQIGPGTYYFLVDTRRADEETGNIQSKLQLLKSDGSIIEPNLLSVNEIGVVSRNAVRYTPSRPMAARLRVTCETGPMIVWLTVVPVAKWKYMPFPTGHGELKSLGIGTRNGKGGSLDKHQWAYHAIKLPSGRWTISFYCKRTDGMNSSVQADLELLDEYGVRSDPTWKLSLNEIGTEARRGKSLYLARPRQIILKAINHNAPLQYTIDIEKAAD
jgi:hypothetical protein